MEDNFTFERQSLASQLSKELGHAADSIHEYLKILPTDRMDWSPSAHLLSLGQLCARTTDLFAWFTVILQMPYFDQESHLLPRTESTDKEVLTQNLQQHQQTAEQLLSFVSDEHLCEKWSLSRGEEVLTTLPRIEMSRLILGQVIHFEGQVALYLQMLKLPYQPSSRTAFQLS